MFGGHSVLVEADGSLNFMDTDIAGQHGSIAYSTTPKQKGYNPLAVPNQFWKDEQINSSMLTPCQLSFYVVAQTLIILFYY